MKSHCLAPDLKDEPSLIAGYYYWYKTENGWPGVIAVQSLKNILSIQLLGILLLS